MDGRWQLFSCSRVGLTGQTSVERSRSVLWVRPSILLPLCCRGIFVCAVKSVLHVQNLKRFLSSGSLPVKRFLSQPGDLNQDPASLEGFVSVGGGGATITNGILQRAAGVRVERGGREGWDREGRGEKKEEEEGEGAGGRAALKHGICR